MNDKNINEYNLVAQTMLVLRLINKLKKNDFFISEYVNSLDIEDENLKIMVTKVGIYDLGWIMINLYVLLVLPKQIFFDNYKDQISKLNQEIYQKMLNYTTTYSGEENKGKVNYINHIRNAVSHSRVSIKNNGEKGILIFSDCWENSNCSLECDETLVIEILEELLKLSVTYCNDKSEDYNNAVKSNR